jgi:hypothetical protein
LFSRGCRRVLTPCLARSNGSGTAFAGNCLVILRKLPLVIPIEVEEFLTIVQADCVSAWNYLEKAPR